MPHPKAEDILKEIAGDVGVPPVDSIGRAYGVTIFGDSIPASPAALSPDDIRSGEDNWRTSVGLDLLADEIRHRGFVVVQIGTFDWDASRYLQATIEGIPAICIVRISTIRDEPFLLEIVDDSGSQVRPAFVRSHSTTHDRLLRTVDVFLSGVLAGRA